LKWCGIRTKLRGVGKGGVGKGGVEKGGVEKGGAGKVDLNFQNCKEKIQRWRKKKTVRSRLGKDNIYVVTMVGEGVAEPRSPKSTNG
jgi:hypothetical protein